MEENKKNAAYNECIDIYDFFGITDEKKELFRKMEKDWAVIPKMQKLNSYDLTGVDIIKGWKK